MESSPLPQESVAIPPDVFDECSQIIEARGMAHVLRMGQRRTIDMGLSKLTAQASEATRRYDRTLGRDWADRAPEAFRKGQFFALSIGWIWLRDEELARLRRETHQLIEPLAVEYDEDDLPHGMHELASDLQELGFTGLAQAEGFEDFLDEYIDQIEYDVTAHNSVKAGAGFMMLGLLAAREHAILDAFASCNLDAELARLLEDGG